MTDSLLPVVGVVSDVTERAVMCADGSVHAFIADFDVVVADPTTKPLPCSPHYLAEHRVITITTEWQRVEP